MITLFYCAVCTIFRFFISRREGYVNTKIFHVILDLVSLGTVTSRGVTVPRFRPDGRRYLKSDNHSYLQENAPAAIAGHGNRGPEQFACAFRPEASRPGCSRLRA